MKKMLVMAVVAAAMSASTSFAAGPYVSASGGVNITHQSDVDVSGLGSADMDYDTGFGLNVAGGYDFGIIRVEGEFGYKNADIDKLSGPGGSVNVTDSDLTVLSFMANTYYDIKNESAVTPFLGAGIGILNGEIDSDGDSEDDTVFGYQLTAGVSFSTSKNLNLDVFYRYQGSATDFSQDDVDISYGSSNIMAGFRYTF